VASRARPTAPLNRDAPGGESKLPGRSSSESREKRRLLNFLLSNGSWKDGKLTVVFKQPFDMLVHTNNALTQRQESIMPTPVDFENWLPGHDSNLQHFG
jgi:hypothetical protein